MGSTPRRLKNLSARKGSSSSRCTRSNPYHHHKKSTITTSSSVSEKLEALKNLIPAQETAGTITGDSDTTSAADRLFQETADYVLLLRSQIATRLQPRLVKPCFSIPPSSHMIGGGVAVWLQPSHTLIPWAMSIP